MTVQEKTDSHEDQDRLHLLIIKYKRNLTQGFQILLKIVIADHLPVTIEICRHPSFGDCQNQTLCRFCTTQLTAFLCGELELWFPLSLC